MRVKYVLILCLVFLALGLIASFQLLYKTSPLYPYSAEFEYQGKVTRIIDGDTLEVDNEVIRLALVDAPERSEPGYLKATRFAASLCPIGSTAYLDIDDGQPVDKYGRIVAVVYCGGKNLNLELWKNGHATIDERFLSVSEFNPYSWS